MKITLHHRKTTLLRRKLINVNRCQKIFVHSENTDFTQSEIDFTPEESNFTQSEIRQIK